MAALRAWHRRQSIRRGKWSGVGEMAAGMTLWSCWLSMMLDAGSSTSNVFWAR